MSDVPPDGRYDGGAGEAGVRAPLPLGRLAWWGYRLTLTRPLTIQGVVVRQRQGIVVEAQTPAGRRGYGEIAPLPGRQRETWQAVIASLHRASTRLVGRPLPPAESASADNVAAWLGDWSPAVQFGLETALLNLLAALRGCSLAHLLNPDSALDVPLSGLVEGAPEAAVMTAHHLAAAGYRTLKLKVGRRLLAEDIALVQQVRAVVGPDVALRLDANRAWTLEQAIIFGRAIAPAGIAYLEEPLVQPTDLPALYAATDLPLALDETLEESSPEAIPDWPGVVAWILKPAVLGGVARTLSWMERARRRAVQPVLSDTFHNSLGLWAEAQLAAAWGERPAAAGLDTFKWLPADSLLLPFDPQAGRLTLPAPDPTDLRWHLLTPLP